MMFARSNIIVRGYDLFLLKGLDESPFYLGLNVSTSHREGYLFFVFEHDDIVISKEFAEDIFTIFMHIPLITRVDTYTVGIVDIHELFKRFIDIKDFEVIGRVIENIIRYIDKDSIFKEFNYTQGWFIFSLNTRKYYEALSSLLGRRDLSNGILIKNGMRLLDGNPKVFRKCDEVEQNAMNSAVDKIYENGRYRTFEGYRYGSVDNFEPKDFILK